MGLSEERKLFTPNRILREADGKVQVQQADICICSLFGFLLGSVLAGGGLYYYVVDEYKVSNELLTEDIYVCLVSLKLTVHR